MLISSVLISSVGLAVQPSEIFFHTRTRGRLARRLTMKRSVCDSFSGTESPLSSSSSSGKADYKGKVISIRHGFTAWKLKQLDTVSQHGS